MKSKKQASRIKRIVLTMVAILIIFPLGGAKNKNADMQYQSFSRKSDKVTDTLSKGDSKRSTAVNTNDAGLPLDKGVLADNSRSTSEALRVTFPDDKFTVNVNISYYSGVIRSLRGYPKKIAPGVYPQEEIRPIHYLEITIVPKSGTVEDWFEGENPLYLVALSGASHTTFRKGNANNYIIDGKDLGQSGLSRISALEEGKDTVLIDFSIVENPDAIPETGKNDLRFSFPDEFKVTATISEGANIEQNIVVESSTVYPVTTGSLLGVTITPADTSVDIKKLLGEESLYKVETTGLTGNDFYFSGPTNSYMSDPQPVTENVTLSIHDKLSERTRITLEPPEENYIYDGTAHTYTHDDSSFNFLKKGSSLRTGDRLEAKSLSAGENSGTHKNVITHYKIYRNNRDVTTEYDIGLNPGAVTVLPRPVYLAAQSGAFVYDGESHTINEWSVLKTGDTYIDKRTGGDVKITIPAEAYPILDEDIELFNQQVSVTGIIKLPIWEYNFIDCLNVANYEINRCHGILTMTKGELAVTANSLATIYSGSNQSGKGYSISKTEYDVSGVSTTGGGLYVGTYTINVAGTPVIKNQNGETITDLIECTTKSGILTILGEVKYDANDGETTVNDTGAYQKGTVIPVHGQGNTVRKNAKFLGWSTDKHPILEIGSTGKDIDMVQSVTMEDTSITLYAVWAKIHPPVSEQPKTGDETSGTRFIFWLSFIGLVGVVIDRKSSTKKDQQEDIYPLR